MKAKLILNLFLLVAILGLGLVAFLEPGVEKTGPKPIALVDENMLTRVTLKNAEIIGFEKKDGHWRLQEPFPAPANEIRVQQLIAIARANVEAQYPIQSENLAQFELDKPKATLILDDLSLDFGGSDPIHMRRYVRRGDSLYLVNDDFFHHLTASATDYVDKKLLPEGAKIKEISLPGFRVILGTDGKWATETATETTVRIPELLIAWNTARAIDVKRPDQIGTGDVVRIGLAEGDPLEFIIIQREPDLILGRKDLGLQYELTGESVQTLLNLPKPEAAPETPTKPETGIDDADEEEDSAADMDEVPPEGEEEPQSDGEEATDKSSSEIHETGEKEEE